MVANKPEKEKFSIKNFFGKIIHFLKTYDWKDYFRNNIATFVAIGGFLGCLILFSFLPQVMVGSRASFWRSAVLAAYIEQATIYLILALGSIFVYLQGNRDLSVGYQVGMLATVFILVVNGTMSVFLGLIVTLIMALACACFNGIIGTYIKMPSIMTSAILMMVFNGGLALLYSDSGRTAMNISVSVSALDTTIARVLILIACIAASCYFLNYTLVGKRVRAIGANQLAAQEAGTNLFKARLAAYCVFGFFLVAAALFAVGRTNSFGERDSSSYHMDIMVMLLMGGMSLSGGYKGGVINALFGALTYVLMDVGLGLCRVSSEYIFLIKAIIFMAIVCITCRKPGRYVPR